MFTETLSQPAFVYAALLLPGTFFLCQALVLAMRITLGRTVTRVWRVGPLVLAVAYSLVLGANVTPYLSTASAKDAAVTAQATRWSQPMPWLRWRSASNPASASVQG